MTTKRNSADPGAVVLVLNSGSSSLKIGLYEVGASQLSELLTDDIETGSKDENPFERIDRLIAKNALPAPVAIGHRIVHGGPNLTAHCRIDSAVLLHLEAAAIFAPLHDPASLALIHQAVAHYPTLPQIACFDTAFHATLPELAYTLPLPRALRSEGVRRYGFHGLSCESAVEALRPDLPDRVVLAHLGNGASITAIKGGRSIDTSMGLTPSGGVIMGTRSGDLDPGVLLFLMREKKLDATSLEQLIDQQSGLFGISGCSGDMRVLEEKASEEADARLAVDMFCYSASKQVAGMIAALGGIDLLAFTGGIGEHDAHVRSAICARLKWAGDFAVRVVPAKENAQIARHCVAIMAQDGAQV
ncbi:acetate kinase [Sphingomonas sp. PAMC26645]|uniref:acetate/propionate family kinase n=1 Tax=Sphingomonas sp. PAMC26645 TaxID=2565555 RepID=UPI00109E1B35|nr:acetate kinase [Sphingomonas sp. PAMC26645]QCB42603.1 acetate kinase [Sphingomonas sp. PAMC26645]